jgi:hypothetical protein
MTRLAVFTMVAVLAASSFVQQARAAGNSANATATAIAQMLIPIAVTKVDDLNFGETYDGDSSLTIAANSTETGSGTAVRKAAEFTITGDGGHSFQYQLSATTVTMTTGDGAGATKQMVVDNFTASPAFSSGVTGTTTLSGSAGASGSKTIYIGGDRAAPVTNQVAGAYVSPNFTLTVTYN